MLLSSSFDSDKIITKNNYFHEQYRSIPQSTQRSRSQAQESAQELASYSHDDRDRVTRQTLSKPIALGRAIDLSLLECGG